MIEKLIEEEKFEDAIQLLKHCNDEKGIYQRIICLYSLGRHLEALHDVEIALEKADKLYYDIKSLHITILLELGEDEVALKNLEDELKLPYIPYEYDCRFNEIYDELMRQRQLANKPISAFKTLTDDEFNELLVKTREDAQLILVLSELSDRNVRKFIPTIRNILKDTNISRLMKTVLIEILIIQEVNQSFTLITDSQQIEIKPTEMQSALSQPNIDKVLQKIELVVSHKEIVLLNSCEDILKDYIGNIYPKLIEEHEINLLAGAIIYYVASLMSAFEFNEELITSRLAIEVDELHKTLEILLKTIEQ